MAFQINENQFTMSTKAEFLSTYASIKEAYKSAMMQVDQAIAHEEHNQFAEAIETYATSLKSIEDIFAIPVGLPDNLEPVETEWLDACVIIQKLKSVKPEATYRLKVLRAQEARVDNDAMEATEDGARNSNASEPLAKKKSVLLENPPTYCDLHNTVGPQSYKDIISGVRDVMALKENDSAILFDTLFESQAKLYKIQANGVVSTLMGVTSMSLVMCTSTKANKWQFLNGVYFIHCTMPEDSLDHGSGKSQNMVWIYVLVPTVTNCYRTEYGAFILPDIESNKAGTAFGLIIVDPSADHSQNDNGELGDLEQFFLDLLEAVLAGTVEQLKQPEALRKPRDTSQQVSSCIVNTADFIARNLVKGAEKTGELMVRGTPYVISKLNPAPPDAAPMSSKVQTSVEVAKNVTSVAVGVTGWVAGKVGSASMAIGRYLAPHIQAQGATLLQKGFGYDSTEANNKMEGALTIAAGAVEGFTTVYNGLETSAKILGTSLSDNSVKIIEYKYGPSAGNVAAGTFDTIGNAFTVSQNVNYITPKGLAKKMAKSTGKAVVVGYKRNSPEEPNVVPAGSLYPNLRLM